MSDQPAADQQNAPDEEALELARWYNDNALGEFMDYCGLRFVAVSGDRMEATWKATPRIHQPYGLVHGGAHCAVVETLASVGAMTWFHGRQPKGKVVGVNNSTDFYRGVGEGELRSVALPIHRGNQQQVWVVETYDADQHLVARGQVRLQNLAPRD